MRKKKEKKKPRQFPKTLKRKKIALVVQSLLNFKQDAVSSG